MATGGIVYIVDDEPGVRSALQTVVEAAGLKAEEFESAEGFLSSYGGQELGCLLLDLRLGGMSGLQLLKRMRSGGSHLPVIIMTGHGDIPAAVESMKLGAVDFLEKPLDHHALMEKIRVALAKAEASQAARAEAAEAKERLSVLTPRERELLLMLVGGRSSKQIAADTGLSLRTVSNHRAHLLAKTGAENTADLVRMAVVSGMASLSNEGGGKGGAGEG